MQPVHHPWSQSAQTIATKLIVHSEHGLTEHEAEKRHKQLGKNLIETTKTRSRFSIFLHQFTSPLIIILCIAAIVTALLAHLVDTLIIGFAVIVNAVIGFYQESKAEKAIEDLRSYITHRTRVIRDGREYEIDPQYLVPGDLIHITSGARISADARLIKEINFTTDEAILTGESLPVEKTIEPLSEIAPLADQTNMVFAGTLAMGGSAYAIVTAIGYDTELGKLAKLVSETKSEKTPLQRALEQLTWVIIVATSFAVLGIFVIGIMNDEPLFDMLLLSIAVLVGSVPEALPISLTAILAIGVERIAKRKGIMRSLTASETLGSTSLIITDKTGTLTQAEMKLIDIDTTNQLISPDFNPIHDHQPFSIEQREILMLARCASDVAIENPDDSPEKWVIAGSDLEVNIVREAALHDIIQTSADRSEIQMRIPFSSRYKFSVIRIPAHYLPGHLQQFEDPHVVMGAPDILIERSYADHETKEKLKAAIVAHSQHGRRVLGIALVTPHTDPSSITIDHVQHLTFLGVLSFYDPIRPEVPAALERIQSYGTRVIMATGDLPGTALSVARELGWHIDETNILTGAELQQLTDEDLIAILDRIVIYARVTPKDKLRITKLHQARGEIVAMTGDGVNDSPSLKAANIGIAVGSGSDVAKSVADLILLDDNFGTIVATIEEGKQILSNIKKVFVYLMSNALDELILIGGAFLLSIPLPLTAVQIIWVNLFTGSLPAMAFAFDRQPMKETEASQRSFFDFRVMFLTIFVGTAVSLCLFSLYYLLLSNGVELSLARSVLFTCFSTYILVIAFSLRDISRPLFTYSLTENKLLIGAVLIGLGLTAVTVYTPFFQDLFAVSGLPPLWLGFVLVWLCFNIAFVELAKWFANFVHARVDKWR